ncbi:hypothetical protein ACWCYZ_33805 [Streptomyces virginiae]
MKIFNSKKRLVLLSLAAAATVGVTAVAAGAVGPGLSLRGHGTLCLVPEAARALEARQVKLEAIAPATAAGNCVTLPGAGTLQPDLTGGEIPLEGGLRFSDAGHRLDVTHVHLHPGARYASADVAKDGAPASNIDLYRFELSLRTVSVGLRTVDTTPIPVNITAPAAAAFTDAFGASPAAAGAPLFTFEGHGEITNPIGSFPKP